LQAIIHGEASPNRRSGGAVVQHGRISLFLATPTLRTPTLAIRSPCRSVPSDNGRGNRMAFMFKREDEDGEPADPPTFKASVSD
jgi:hypothetical protein